MFQVIKKRGVPGAVCSNVLTAEKYRPPYL